MAKSKETPIKYVVISTPRSATGYTARVLSELGLNCGHEKSFCTPHQLCYRAGEEIWGDSSWLAAPFIKDMPPTTLVLHQLRDPIKTLDSMMTRRQLRGCNPGGEAPRGEYTQFLRKYVENWESEESQHERLARFWVEWNLRIEQANHPNYLRYWVEDMDEELLLRIISHLGVTVSPSQIQSALEIDKSVNHHPGEGQRIVPWAEKFCAQETPKPNVRSLSRRYGYSW
jgi:hypothetical protein